MCHIARHVKIYRHDRFTRRQTHQSFSIIQTHSTHFNNDIRFSQSQKATMHTSQYIVVWKPLGYVRNDLTWLDMLAYTFSELSLGNVTTLLALSLLTGMSPYAACISVLTLVYLYHCIACLRQDTSIQFLVVKELQMC